MESQPTQVWMDRTSSQIKALQKQMDQKHDQIAALQGQVKELTGKIEKKDTLIEASKAATEAVILAAKESDTQVANQFEQLKQQIESKAAKDSLAHHFKAVDYNFLQLEALVKAVAQQADQQKEDLKTQSAKTDLQFKAVDHNFLQLDTLAKKIDQQADQLSELTIVCADSDLRVRVLSGEAFASGAVYGVLKSFLQDNPNCYPAQFMIGMDLLGLNPARMTVAEAVDLAQLIPSKSWAEIKEMGVAKVKQKQKSRRSRSSD